MIICRKILWLLFARLCQYHLQPICQCHTSKKVEKNIYNVTHVFCCIHLRCDTKNIGLTMLCKFDGDVPLPAIWSHQVRANISISHLNPCPSFFTGNIRIQENLWWWRSSRVSKVTSRNIISISKFLLITCRPHEKDNSRRRFLQKTKSQAIFDGMYVP